MNKVAVECFRIALQIDIGRIQKGGNSCQGLFTDIAIGDEYITKSCFLGKTRCVVGELEEDGRLGVGVGD